MTPVSSQQYWLMKSEPDAFSIDDLITSKNQTTPWDGVRNFQARNYIRDGMKIGDLAFFYHSSCKIPGIVGIVEIVKGSYPDKTSFDPRSAYYDPKTSPATPRWYCVDVKYKEKFDETLSLEVLKTNPKLAGFTLLNRGNRLSVMPLTTALWKTILAMR